MNKYVRAVFLLNKTEALAVVKPLYCSVFHGAVPPFLHISQGFSPEAAI
jgi:hypothetical protein